MSGFGGFGTGSPGGGLFGAKPPDQQQTGFAMPTTTAGGTPTGSAFGTPAFGATGGGTGLFGAQQQTPTFGTGFGLKQPTTAATGFTFGATNTATTTASTGFTFGATNTNTTPAPAGGGFTFGATSTPATTASTGFTFGSSNTNTVAPTFGSFGTPAAATGTAAATTASTGFSFPSTSTTLSTPGTGLTFGMTSAATTTTATATTTSAAPLGLSFGVGATSTPATTTTTATTGFTFSQPATTTALTFGPPKTTGGFTFGTTTTTTSSLTFNLGTAAATTTTPTLGAGLFGTPKTSEGVTITTTTSAPVGLGGINTTQTTQGLSGSGSLEPKQAKDHTLPDIILQTLNDFQTFTKQQKSISVEISHGSSKPLKKVQEDTEAMESLLTSITGGLTKNGIAVDKLKTETAQGLHQAEMAQRNHEIPPGLEYDNSAPSDYFNDLVTKFETDTARLRVQIEASEKHLKSLTQCSTISPQELTLAMRRLHETLIVLAARVQALHTTVQSQKEQFKNLRRVYLKDETNFFEKEAADTRAKKQTAYSLRSLTGPTPFSDTPGPGIPFNMDGLAMLASSAAAAASIPSTSSNPSK